MHPRRFIPVVDGLSLRIAPSGLASAVTIAPATDLSDAGAATAALEPTGAGAYPLNLIVPDSTAYAYAIPVIACNPFLD